LDRAHLDELQDLEQRLHQLRTSFPGLLLTIAQVESRINELINESSRRRPHFLYSYLEPVAKLLKTALQMAVGVVAVVFLWRTVWGAFFDSHHNNLPTAERTLTTIAAALAIAAAIELAYTLFTDGPDESINPLTLGLSAAVLLQLARADRLSLGEGLALVFYSVGLVVLFFVRNKMVDIPAETDKPWARLITWCSRQLRANGSSKITAATRGPAAETEDPTEVKTAAEPD
jgi:hypothetical protein